MPCRSAVSGASQHIAAGPAARRDDGARGHLGNQAAEFWILADPGNPLSLRWSIGDRSQRLQVIKVSYPIAPTTTSSAPAPADAAGGSTTAGRIEHDLVKGGPAVVYGTYFDFGTGRLA